MFGLCDIVFVVVKIVKWFIDRQNVMGVVCSNDCGLCLVLWIGLMFVVVVQYIVVFLCVVDFGGLYFYVGSKVCCVEVYSLQLG